MKQSREIRISNRIITAADLRRVGEVFEKQSSLAEKSEHHFSIDYAVQFSDGTTINSDSNDAFDDDTLTAFPARPTSVSIAFYNYSLKRSISVSLAHGDFTSSNTVTVSASEPAWLAETFDALRRCFDGMRPQTSWVRRYSTAIVCLCAVSFACLVDFFERVAHRYLPAQPPEFLRPLAVPLAAGPDWVFRLFVGLFFVLIWPGPMIEGWLRNMWPNVEFDFGLVHLREERDKRRLAKGVMTLIVLPLLGNLVTIIIQTVMR